MIDFPHVLHSYPAYSGLGQSVKTSKTRMLWYLGDEITRDDLTAFIQADTDKKMKRFMEKWPKLLTYGENELIDYVDARRLLVLAANLKAMIDEQRCSREALHELGFLFDDLEVPWVSSPSVQSRSYWWIRGKGLTKYLEESTCDPNSPLHAAELSSIFEFTPSMVIGMNNDYVEEGLPPVTEEGGEQMIYLLHSLDFPTREKGHMQAMAEALLDELITTFLYDVRTLTIGGGHEIRRAGSVLSSLWYCFVLDINEGRAGHCQVCGKPYISIGERGKPRKYCSGACNKRAQRQRAENAAKNRQLE